MAELVLIGGGVGINPLLSMLLHHLHLVKEKSVLPGNVHLLYSSKMENELLFKEKLLNVASANNNVKVQFFATSEAPPGNNIVIKGKYRYQLVSITYR